MDFLKQASASLGGNAGESALLQQAEGFLGDNQSSAPPAGGAPPPSANAPPANAPGTGTGTGSESYSQLYGSAQTLYQGLNDKFTGKQSNIDDQQLAGAAANVLKAAENSGFGKDSQYGDYINKAESYLQNYGQATATSQGVPAVAPPANAPPAPQ